METTPALACHACGSATGPGASFCIECGAALGGSCTRCQRAIPSAARFCPHCGAPTAAGAGAPAQPSADPRSSLEIPHGERRRATVLFADLSGYTALNQALDPEDVARVLNQLKVGATRIVEANGGVVNQFVGDEVMALFGVPRAHDDDAQRAVRAALELRDHVRALGDELAPQLGTALRMHIGINTGLMITQLRDGRDGLYGVTGDTVNTAARLAQNAESDEILIGAETQRAVSAAFATESLGELRLRGRTEPFVAHRVLGAASSDGAALSATEFVGRRAEREILASGYERVRAGTGSLLAVSGEPGIGKSRLCEEFASSLPAEALVLRGQCRPFGAVAPYEPFREVLRAALLGDGDEGHEADHVIARVLRELPGCGEHLAILLGLMSLRSDAYPFPAADAERSQTAILAALQAVLGQLAETRPVVVVLTDWHWADAASEHALDHLVEGIASRRLLLVVNFRSHYQPPWATSAVRLDLPPLGVDDARPIVQRIVGDGASADLVQRIYERTGGNPLFVEELSRTLADLGSTGATDAETLVDGVVPDNVAAVLRARIDRLPPACIEVLKVASVIGESFALAVLRDVSELERVDAAIDELVHAGLVQPVDGDGLRFKHALVRDVAYELLLLRRRRALHGAVGCVIERREADRLDEHVERLAHHFARSDDLDKAVLYLVRSGDKAVATGAMLQALGQYFEAVRILGAMPETPAQMRDRVAITLKLAHAAIYRPSTELREILRTGFELCERIGDARAASYSLYWMGFLENALGGWPAARELFERCLAQAQARGDDKLVSLACSNFGQTLFNTGDYSGAMRLLEQGVALRRKISSERAAAPLVSYPIAYQAMIHAERGRFDLAAERIDEATALSAASGRVYTEAAVVGTRAMIDLFRGDWPACRRNAGELERKSKRIGSTFMTALSLGVGGYARCFDGEPGEGIAMMRASVALLERSDIRMMSSFFYGCLAEGLALGGDCDEAPAFAARALEHTAHDDRFGEPQALRVLMIVAARRSREQRASIDSHLAATVAAARRRGSVREEAISLFRFAEALAQRDPDSARERAKECAERFRTLQMPWYAARADDLFAAPAAR